MSDANEPFWTDPDAADTPPAEREQELDRTSDLDADEVRTEGADATSPEDEISADAAKAALERAILEIVRQPGYRPVKPRIIADKLGIPPEGKTDVRRAVKRLVRRGLLVYEANHLVRAAVAERPQAHGNRVVGIFHRAQGGFGFVRRRAAAPGGDRPDDVYVPAQESLDAATGDTVLVQVSRQRNRFGKPQGVILEIIERESHDFVGTYFEDAGMGYVRVDGGLFSQPIWVGDAGAKDVHPDDKVVIEMVRFPTHYHDGEGVVTRVLGARGTPGIDTLSIIYEHHLPGDFAEDALEDARRAAEAFDESIGENRLDLTALPTLTIDPIDARDFDDAITLEKQADGSWRLGVHIADVAHFVPHGSAIDREAYDRATSVYLPDRVIPMLPELISNGLASLQPGKVRYTKSAFIEFTAEGVRTHVELHNSAIRSDKRLAYEQVDEFLANREPWREKLGAKLFEMLGGMHELAMILRRRRFARGALEMEMPEVKIDLDRQGRVSGAHVVPHTESHQIIEEFMLAANEAVAEHLFAQEIAFLRRVHAPPDPRKLEALTDFVKELGFETANLQSRFALQKLLDETAGRPERHAVHYAVLRAMQRAEYSPEEEGHYALASDTYCHFTSPIRRYPDLTVHRTLDALLRGQKPRAHFDELVVAGEHCSERERRAEQAERELTKVKLLTYLEKRVGEQMNAVVTGVESYGLYVQGLELPAEGLIRVDSLTDDFYRHDRRMHTLSGHRSGNQFRLGDRLRVAVSRVDLDRRELDFRLVARIREEPGRKRRSSSRAADGKSGRSPKPKRRGDGSPKDRKSSGKKRSRRD